MKRGIASALILLCLAAPLGAASVPASSARQPKYPLKTARTLHNGEAIARARENVKKYPSAKRLVDDIIKRADAWVEWTDEDLRFLLTAADVPRAFAVNAHGCPQCGGKIIEKSGGDYGWIIDPKRPFKVTCPVDGSVYPTNDYERFYRSGFKTKIGWDTPHVDDGWGAPANAEQKKSAGERYWFVAYYNHWMWHRHLVPGIESLAQAYTLTGDARYAHKAAVMLHRVAEVYPAMDHARQSRYGALSAERGAVYEGKVVNHIWEASLAQSVAEAYDAVWETIDADAELQRQTGKTGEQIRAFIDANLLEDAIDAYFSGKIRGNFGMHQAALVRLAQVRQHGETSRWFDVLMNENASTYPSLGLNYALYNLVSRDGVPIESAPGYNNIWVRKIADYGDELQRAGRDVFGSRRAKRMFDAVIDQMHLDGKYTPSWGDSGNIFGVAVGADPPTFAIAHRHYGDDEPRYAAMLKKLGATGASAFKSYESLFHLPIEVSPDATLPLAKPRLLDGAGLAILNNKADRISLALTYGQKHGHGHFDRLNFELFAHGEALLPDLGYPDAMNDFVPGIYTWTKNTVAHNTVVVDGRRQLGGAPGEVKIFAGGQRVRVVDVEAKQTYPQTSGADGSYRRAMIMIDVDAENSYFVDIFTVRGGRQHDYSLHGPIGDFQMIGGAWSEPGKGTLAGDDVALGEIYDDADLAKASGGFSAYTGSGFQHLFNVRTHQGGDAVAQFKHARSSQPMARVRVLDQPGQMLMLCDARVSPVKTPQVIKYLIARRSGDENLSSRFVSVIEPFAKTPIIQRVTPVKLQSGEGVALAVERVGGEVDLVIYDPAASQKKLVSRGINTRAEVAVSTFDGGSAVATTAFRVFAAAPPAFSAKVVGVLPMTSAVEVAADPERPFDPADVVGRVVHFTNGRRRSAHTVISVERERDSANYIFTLGDDILVGLAKVDAVTPDALTTTTALPLAPAYTGVTLADDLFRFQHPLKHVERGRITLERPLPPGHPIKPGDNVWLLDVGVGDTVQIPTIRDIARN